MEGEDQPLMVVSAFSTTNFAHLHAHIHTHTFCIGIIYRSKNI